MEQKLSLSENQNVEELKEKILKLEADMAKVSDLKENIKTTVKCKECGKAFAKSFQLEMHLAEHEKDKQFKCETCGKEFFLKWRLKKHEGIHSSPSKACKYFVNKQECLYESIGCMFLHHNLPALMKTVANQCLLCREQMKSKDDLINHVQSHHEVYFLGIMELTNKSNQA